MEIILKYLDPVIRIISFFALPFLCGGLIQKYVPIRKEERALLFFRYSTILGE